MCGDSQVSLMEGVFKFTLGKASLLTGILLIFDKLQQVKIRPRVPYGEICHSDACARPKVFRVLLQRHRFDLHPSFLEGAFLMLCCCFESW